MNKHILLHEYNSVISFRQKLEAYCECRDALEGYSNGFYLHIFRALYINTEDLAFEQIADRFFTYSKKIQRFREEIATMAERLKASYMENFKNQFIKLRQQNL